MHSFNLRAIFFLGGNRDPQWCDWETLASRLVVIVASIVHALRAAQRAIHGKDNLCSYLCLT